MPSLWEAHHRHGLHYLSFVQAHARDFEVLDRESAQVQAAYQWWSQQTDIEALECLLALIRGLAPYLQGRALQAMLVEYCQAGLRASDRLKHNPSWLWRLSAEAYWALGQWDRAFACIRTAINVARVRESDEFAQAVLTLGHYQFNRGDYAVALKTLEEAEALFAQASNWEGVASAKSDVAAFALNRGELKRALSLYLEVDQLRRRVDPSGPADHTLLMLGVVYRRLKQYDRARESLGELLSRAEARRARGAAATSKHHLAWVSMDLGQLDEAQSLGQEADWLYEEVGDPRGGSDAAEQLGLIALAEGNMTLAQEYLERSLVTRRRLGNQQGTASSLRHLARLHLVQRDFATGLRYLWQSLALYWQLGVLTAPRLVKILSDLLPGSY